MLLANHPGQLAKPEGTGAITTTQTQQEDILGTAAAWRDAGRNVGLATVIATWGSSPRPVGSQLVIDSDGHFEGSVSGGCIEGAVIHEALEVMEEGKPRILQYGVTHEMAWEVGLACGGQVNVYVEKVE